MKKLLTFIGWSLLSIVQMVIHLVRAMDELIVDLYILLFSLPALPFIYFHHVISSLCRQIEVIRQNLGAMLERPIPPDENTLTFKEDDHEV
jgi:hypothetical protein